MEFIKVIGNDVLHYPSWLLISSSVFMVLLEIAHIVRFMKTLARVHLYLVSFLALLCLQYVLATQDINVPGLTIVVNLFTVSVNLWLLNIWAQLMANHIGYNKAGFIRFVASVWLLLFILSSVATLVGGIYIRIVYKSSYDDCDDCKAIDIILLIWHITLGIAIAANLTQACLTVILQFCLGQVHEDKRKRRSQLGLLSLSSLLLALNNLGILFDIPLVNVIPYLLAHIVFILVCGSIAGIKQMVQISKA
jgi:hypothetical protein